MTAAVKQRLRRIGSLLLALLLTLSALTVTVTAAIGDGTVWPPAVQEAKDYIDSGALGEHTDDTLGKLKVAARLKDAIDAGTLTYRELQDLLTAGGTGVQLLDDAMRKLLSDAGLPGTYRPLPPALQEILSKIESEGMTADDRTDLLLVTGMIEQEISNGRITDDDLLDVWRNGGTGNELLDEAIDLALESDPDDDNSGLFGWLSDILDALNPVNWINALIEGITDWLLNMGRELLYSAGQLIQLANIKVFFESEGVIALISVFQTTALVLLTVGLILRGITIAERTAHGEAVNIGDLIVDFGMAYGMILLSAPIVLFTATSVSEISSALGIAAGVDAFAQSSAGLGGNVIFALVFVILSAILFFVMVYRLLKYMISLLCLVLTGYLYVFDLARGNNSAVGQWGRDVVGTILTFSLQYLAFQYGCDTLATAIGSGLVTSDYIIGLAWLFGSAVIPHALNKWGRASYSVRSGAGQIAGTAASIAKMFI